MKKVKAFLVALLMMIITIIGYSNYVNNKIAFNNKKFGTWINSSKFKSPDVIKANLDHNSVVVFGSSELNHGKDTKYHPEKMFANKNLNMMLIGEGYDQCLFHATILAALEPSLKDRKVVLVLSPQWFRKGGVKPKAYASRFSESGFIEMLENPKLSDETKRYIVDRSKSLLTDDSAMLDKVKTYEKVALNGEGNIIDNSIYSLSKLFLREKQKQSIVEEAHISGIDIKLNKKHKKEKLDKNPIDWNEYLFNAEIDGRKASSNNKFAVKDKYYNERLKPHLEERKDKGVITGYSESEEYDDFECFLKVCKELDIKPLIINIPVNGKWYDYTGFNKEKREEYYSKIRKLISKYNVNMADFSDKEYTDYFLEDTIHLGWKGWVYVNESIYKYCEKDQ